jgi:16S rRNA C967 or C1407 C5-methylase (RsmB/RsmF family)
MVNERIPFAMRGSSTSTFEEKGVTTITSGEAFGYAFYPHKTNGEGFFIAALQKPLASQIPRK